MIRVVADTNVLVSAIVFGGISSKILDLARDDKIELLTSKAILYELAGVLESKFQFTPDRIKETLFEIGTISTIVNPDRSISIIKADKADNRILECAVKGKVQYIVSGDTKHLQPLGSYRGITILSPAGFMKRFQPVCPEKDVRNLLL
jgi:putative PIN family toxin of toxin-antitoxin system